MEREKKKKNKWNCRGKARFVMRIILAIVSFFFWIFESKKAFKFCIFCFVDSVVYEIARDLTIDTSTATAAVICRRNFARYSPIFDILIAYTTIQKLKNFFLRLSIILLASSIFSFFLQTSLKGILIVDRSNNKY